MSILMNMLYYVLLGITYSYVNGDEIYRDSRFLISPNCGQGGNTQACLNPFTRQLVPVCCLPPTTGLCCRNRDYCLVKPCAHGKCTNAGNTFKCTCGVGYTGTKCDKVINHCSPNPCVHGSCRNNPSGYSCVCQTGFIGTKCEQVSNHCKTNVCGRHGACVNSLTGYTCRCYTGYTGAACQNVINLLDHCSSNPCKHGSCRNNLSGYSCYCQTGYTGSRCEQVVNHCSSNPCTHGSCRNNLSGYSCYCQTGYRGTRCDQVIQLIDYCITKPCVRGTCVSSFSGYTCKCLTGYKGTKCDQVMDLKSHCSPNPCARGSYQSGIQNSYNNKSPTPSTTSLPMKPNPHCRDLDPNCPYLQKSVNICSNAEVSLGIGCHLTCGYCTSTTTAVPTTVTTKGVQSCVDDIRLTCDQTLCTTDLKMFCPVTCNICRALTTTWIRIPAVGRRFMWQ